MFSFIPSSFITKPVIGNDLKIILDKVESETGQKSCSQNNSNFLSVPNGTHSKTEAFKKRISKLDISAIREGEEIDHLALRERAHFNSYRKEQKDLINASPEPPREEKKEAEFPNSEGRQRIEGLFNKILTINSYMMASLKASVGKMRFSSVAEIDYESDIIEACVGLCQKIEHCNVYDYKKFNEVSDGFKNVQKYITEGSKLKLIDFLNNAYLEITTEKGKGNISFITLFNNANSCWKKLTRNDV